MLYFPGMSVVKEVKVFFAENWPAADRAERPLVVAVSGGPDSVALLHALARRGIFPAGQIVVAHLNHMLRPEAAADAAFVHELAGRWELVFRGGEADVAQLAREEGLSIEAAAREARYRFLAQVARDEGAQAIATGHHRRDQAETVLMHILRGSGLIGLAGMRPVAPLPGAPDLTLLRPLLGVSRAAIEDYCRRHDLAFVQDHTNLDTTLLRNRLRHRLLPELEETNPRIEAHLHNLAVIVAAEDGLLAEITAETWSEIVEESGRDRIALNLVRWRALPLALKRRTLRHALSILAPEVTEFSFEATELARTVAEAGQTGDQATLPLGLTLEVGYEQLVIAAGDAAASTAGWPQLAGDETVCLEAPGRLALAGGWVISADEARDVPFAQIAGNPDPWRAYIRAEYEDELFVRPRGLGERFTPLGMGGQSALVSDVMTNRKIPAAFRARWPVVACGDHLLWLAGHVLDERARVQPGSRRVLLLQVRRGNVD